MMPDPKKLVTTPEKPFSAAVLALIENLKCNAQPCFLSYTYVSKEYLAGHCLDNCEMEAMKTGHKVIYGWMLWDAPTLRAAEAEFHAVMLRENGLEDITPRVDHERLVLFLQDTSRSASRLDHRTWRTWMNASQFPNQRFVPPKPLNIVNALRPSVP